MSLHAAAVAAVLTSSALTAWNAHVSTTEARIAREYTSHERFFDRTSLLQGHVLVEGRTIEVPSALIHDWRGAVWIPKITVPRLIANLQDEVPRQEDVLQSRILDKGPDWMRVSLKLQRRKIVTAVYNTEHLVTFVREGPTRATSTSTSTRIVEVAGANTADEHELPEGDDRGFLWKLNAYWRYEQAGDGVIAECESLTLSRDVPSLVRWFAMPSIERTARESLTRTLIALRSRFA